MKHLILICALLFSSCSHLDYTITKRSAIDAQIVAARTETQAKLDALTKQQVALLNARVDQLLATLQLSSNYLYKGSATYLTLRVPTRAEFIMGQSIAQTSLQLPAPSAATQVEVNQQLRTELDETKTTMEQLKAQYDKELNDAKTVATTSQAKATEITNALTKVDADRLAAVTEGKQKGEALEDARNKAADKELADKDAELKRAESDKAMKTKVSSVLGLLALACLAGAIWSPVFKEKLGLGTAILGFASVAVWYIQPWMIAAVAGVGILALVVWAVQHHYIESRTLTNVTHAIQSVKDTAKADYDKVLAPALSSWNVLYDKATGEVVKDVAAIKRIDDKLKATGAL